MIFVFFDFCGFWILFFLFLRSIWSRNRKTAKICAVMAYFYFSLRTTHKWLLNRSYQPYFGSTGTFVMFRINRNHKIFNKNLICRFGRKIFKSGWKNEFYATRRKIFGVLREVLSVNTKVFLAIKKHTNNCCFYDCQNRHL